MSIKNTDLIIGATGGIGAALARSIYAQGKRVIITGRRQSILSTMAAELPGLETACFDFSDIPALSSHVSNLTTKYPDLDTVIINVGVQNILSFKDPAEAGTPELIAAEVTTNLIAPIVLCQAIIPHFLSSKNPCSIIMISSGLALRCCPLLPRLLSYNGRNSFFCLCTPFSALRNKHKRDRGISTIHRYRSGCQAQR